MVPDFVPLYAVITVLFSLLYFAFASFPFLFVRLDVPEVTRLFRGLFRAYFWMVSVTGFVASAAFAASGRVAFTAGMFMIGAAASAMRKWTLRRIDAQQEACRVGGNTAAGRLRAMHWGSMLANVLLLASVISSLRYVL